MESVFKITYGYICMCILKYICIYNYLYAWNCPWCLMSMRVILVPAHKINSVCKHISQQTYFHLTVELMTNKQCVLSLRPPPSFPVLVCILLNELYKLKWEVTWNWVKLCFGLSPLAGKPIYLNGVILSSSLLLFYSSPKLTPVLSLEIWFSWDIYLFWQAR